MFVKMFFPGVFMILILALITPATETKMPRFRRSPFLIPGIKQYLKNTATDLIAQNETKAPTDLYHSLHRMKLKIQPKTSSTSIKYTLSDFDNYADQLQASTNKAQKKLRNSVKKLRSIAFTSGDKFIKDCLKTFNRYVMYSTEHTVHIMKSRNSTNIELFINSVVECTNSSGLSSETAEIVAKELRVQIDNCYDNTLAMISSVILSAHDTVTKANETTQSTVDILKNCASSYKDDNLGYCIEDGALELNKNITSAGTALLLKSIECLQALNEQGELYSQCMQQIVPKTEDYMLDKHNFDIRRNCNV